MLSLKRRCEGGLSAGSSPHYVQARTWEGLYTRGALSRISVDNFDGVYVLVDKEQYASVLSGILELTESDEVDDVRRVRRDIYDQLHQIALLEA